MGKQAGHSVITVYEAILEKIMTRQYFPGSHIIEEQLSNELGVSRTPIRDALRRLCYEGLVTMVPYQGAMVSSPTRGEIREAYQCKQLMEADAIRLSAERISAADIELLEKLIEEDIQSRSDKDFIRFIRINQKFHSILASASENRFYEKYINELNVKCSVYLMFFDRFIITSPEDSKSLIAHKAIVAACKNKDGKAAAEAMWKHNQETFRGLDIK